MTTNLQNRVTDLWAAATTMLKIATRYDYKLLAVPHGSRSRMTEQFSYLFSVLTETTKEEYQTLSESLREDCEELILIEYSTYDNIRAIVTRMKDGSFRMDLTVFYFDKSKGETAEREGEYLSWKQVTMDSFRDCKTLIDHIAKPHHTVLRSIRSRQRQVGMVTDFDRAMAQ